MSRLGTTVTRRRPRSSKGASLRRVVLSRSITQTVLGVPEDCLRVVDEVRTSFGRVDYLINNAGVTVDKTVRKVTWCQENERRSNASP